jgi:S1-C subfamily serine protease
MNTSIYSPSGASAGIGFAIPVDTVRQIADSLIANGRIIRPVIGITYLEGSQARSLGIDRGVLVLSVVPGSNAEKAGVVGTSRSAGFGSLQLGDVVTAIDGDEVETEADLFRILENHKVGDKVRLKVTNSRDGERLLSVKLGASSQD